MTSSGGCTTRGVGIEAIWYQTQTIFPIKVGVLYGHNEGQPVVPGLCKQLKHL